MIPGTSPSIRGLSANNGCDYTCDALRRCLFPCRSNHHENGRPAKNESHLRERFRLVANGDHFALFRLQQRNPRLDRRFCVADTDSAEPGGQTMQTATNTVNRERKRWNNVGRLMASLSYGASDEASIHMGPTFVGLTPRHLRLCSLYDRWSPTR